MKKTIKKSILLTLVLTMSASCLVGCGKADSTAKENKNVVDAATIETTYQYKGEANCLITGESLSMTVDSLGDITVDFSDNPQLVDPDIKPGDEIMVTTDYADNVIRVDSAEPVVEEDDTDYLGALESVYDAHNSNGNYDYDTITSFIKGKVSIVEEEGYSVIGDDDCLYYNESDFPVKTGDTIIMCLNESGEILDSYKTETNSITYSNGTYYPDEGYIIDEDGEEWNYSNPDFTSETEIEICFDTMQTHNIYDDEIICIRQTY